MHRAATALTPLPVQKTPDTRRHAKSLKCLDITSCAPGVCTGKAQRERDLPQERKYEGLRTQSRVLCRHGARFVPV